MSARHKSVVGTATRAGVTFAVRLPGPLDIPASLEMFRRSGDDLIDRWDGSTLVRTLPVGDRHVAYACTHSGTTLEPTLHVTVADTAAAVDARPVAEAVAGMFVPAPPEFAELVARDRVIAQLNARYPGLRPVRQFELFAALVRCISAQQVNLRWAATTRARLAEAFGTRHEVAGQVVYSLDVSQFAGLAVDEIRALQLTTRKAEYIISVAQAIASGRLSLAQLAQMRDDEVITALAGLRGIGRWSAEWILARTLGRPRVVAGDLAVRKAVGAAYLGMPPKGPLPSEDEVREATAHWGPSGSIAQQLLLQGYGSGTLAT